MAEFFQSTIEDDKSEDDEKESKKDVPLKPLKKLPSLPLIPPAAEKLPPNLPEAPKRVEVLPSMFEIKEAPNQSPEKKDDEEGEDEGGKQKAKTDDKASNNGSASQAPEAPELAAPSQEAKDDLFDLSEEMVHLREQLEAGSPPTQPEVTAAASPAEAVEGESPEPPPPATPPPPPPPFHPPQPAESSPPPEPPKKLYAPWSTIESYPNVSPDRHESYSTMSSYSAVTREQVSSEISSAVSAEAKETREKQMRLVVAAGIITYLFARAYVNRKIESQAEAVKLGLDFVQDQVLSAFRNKEQPVQAQPAPRPPGRPVQTPERPVPPPVAVAAKETLKPVEAAPKELSQEMLQQLQEQQEEIFDKDGNKITLLPGQHIERGAGGYSVVMEHGRVVHDAITYGEAYKRDQKREQLGDDVFASLKAGGGGGAAGASSDAPAGLGGASLAGTGASTDTDSEHAGWQDQRQTVDIGHHDDSEHSLLSKLASPWPWLAVAILLIIYFIAALS